MAVSESQKRATYNYKKRNYDFYQLLLPYGKKEELKKHAAEMGESLNQFVNRAINNQLQLDLAKIPEEHKKTGV